MRIKDRLILRHVGNDYIIVKPEQDTVDMTKVYTLNESLAWLWEKLKGIDFTEDSVADLLVERYDVDKEHALKDVHILIQDLIAQELIYE